MQWWQVRSSRPIACTRCVSISEAIPLSHPPPPADYYGIFWFKRTGTSFSSQITVLSSTETFYDVYMQARVWVRAGCCLGDGYCGFPLLSGFELTRV
jgi:hypothetical protein